MFNLYVVERNFEKKIEGKTYIDSSEFYAIVDEKNIDDFLFLCAYCNISHAAQYISEKIAFDSAKNMFQKGNDIKVLTEVKEKEKTVVFFKSCYLFPPEK